MSTTYVTKQGDMVDAICRRVYGSERGTAERVLAENPGLAARGPVLPENVVIVLPDLPPQPTKRRRTLNLWD